MVNVLLAALALAVLGLLLGFLIGFTAKRFAVQVDPRVEEIISLLPGANCGGCGYAGCADYARAIVEDGVSPSGCSVVDEENFLKISQAAGQETGKRERKVAVVYCSGDRDHRLLPRSGRVEGTGDADADTGREERRGLRRQGKL